MFVEQIKRVPLHLLKEEEGLDYTPYLEVATSSLRGDDYAILQGRKKGTQCTKIDIDVDRVWFPYSPKICETSSSTKELLRVYNTILLRWDQTTTIRTPMIWVFVSNKRNLPNLDPMRMSYISAGKIDSRERKEWI